MFKTKLEFVNYMLLSKHTGGGRDRMVV